MTATYPDQIDAVALLVKIGDGGSPEVFSHPCLINTNRSYAKTANTTATEIPRCDDPTQTAKTIRVAISTDRTISGDGILPALSSKTYDDMVGKTVNIQVQVGSASGALVVTGPFILQSFELTGSKHGDTVTASLKFEQADEPLTTVHA